jgi:hypothetical protein
MLSFHFLIDLAGGGSAARCVEKSAEPGIILL